MNVPDRFVGRSLKCTECGQPFDVLVTKAQSTSKQCPFCKEDIRPDAIKCKHCGTILDGSAQAGDVVVKGIDPFAGYHTEIQGKKKGKLSFVGVCGVVLGLLMAAMSAASITAIDANGEVIFLGVLFGLSFALASFLWARR